MLPRTLKVKMICVLFFVPLQFATFSTTFLQLVNIFHFKFSILDINSLCAFIRRSISYDGGIGQGPGLESHGGSTFCAIASLALIGRLWDGSSALSAKDIERLKQWAILKQTQGFHGRIGKADDSCYAFWLGATLTVSS